MERKRRPILVGLSGGVDSAVAALLLQREGWKPEGVFLRTWSPPHLPCPQEEDRIAAIANAVAIGIPFLTLDSGEAYRSTVFLPMVAAYREGLTPNPDIWCNRFVKFRFLAEYARGKGMPIATGHYARLVRGREGKPLLLRARDERKDQSYFLSSLPREILPFLRFPLGIFTKRQVRDIAAGAMLPSARRRDSVGLCFLGQHTLEALLAPYLPLRKGPVLTLSGEVIGEHRGLPLYTIGQRHGFTIFPKTPHTTPWYVVAKDSTKNALFVHSDIAVTAVSEISLSQWNWLIDPFQGWNVVWVRYRHGQPLRPAFLRVGEGGNATVRFLEPQVAVTPGQWLAAYTGEGVVVGGGMIAPYPFPAIE